MKNLTYAFLGCLILCASDLFSQNLRKGYGMPIWALSNTVNNNTRLLTWDTTQTAPNFSNLPYGGTDAEIVSGVALNNCGEIQFYLVHSGSRTSASSLFCAAPDGTILNPTDPFNMKWADRETHIMRVPTSEDEWYIIYQQNDSDPYALKGLLYSKVRYRCGVFSIVQKDVFLPDNNGTRQLYTTGKAISKTTPLGPNTHWLYVCRRSITSPITSLDRFLIDKNGIRWNANTGDISVPTWFATILASPIELSWQEDKIAVTYRYNSANHDNVVIWDANLFSNAPNAFQKVDINALIVQPDPAGLVSSARSVTQVANTVSSLAFFQYLGSKVRTIEFSPSGQYLYFGRGGYPGGGGQAHLTYLGQIDLDTPYPYAVRIQTQTTPNSIYDRLTGIGCSFSSGNCIWNPVFDIHSAYDGRLYFSKQNKDSLYVIPNPDAPMPQMLAPGRVSLATSTAPNIYAGPGNVVRPMDHIDGYRYIVNTEQAEVIVSLRGCEDCIASASAPQDIEISSENGSVIFCESIAQCPDTIRFCVHPDSVYRITWIQTGFFFDSAVVNGIVQQDSFSLSTSNGIPVQLPAYPIICDTTSQPISLTASPTGGIFTGPGVVGNQFFPALAGKGDHWIVYKVNDALTKCEGIDSVQVKVEFCCDLGAISITSQAINISCFGQNDGSISTSVSGGIHLPFEFSLDGQNYQSNGQFLALAPGSYTVYIRDTLDCDTSILLDIGEPEEVQLELDSVGNISCFGRTDAFIFVDTSGGVQPFTFQLNGSPSGNSTQFENLSPGNYQIIATDANNCSDTLDVEIPNIPSLDIVFELIEDEKCLGEMNGRVRFRGVGGSGSSYEFSLDGVNFQEADSFANLIPGNYTLFITDSDGCQINRPFTIEAGSQTTARFNVSAEPCILPMLISLRNESQNAVQYDWNLGDGEMRQGFEPAFTYADEGSYLITLITTDANGCRDTATQPITMSKAVTAAFDISPDITNPRFIEEAYFEFQNRSQNADFYHWDFGDNQFSEIENPVHRYNEAGDFCVKLEARSFAGCSDDTTICGINIFQSFVFFPSAFTPNGDGINETFDVVHSATFGGYQLDVYSRWGMQVFSTTSPDESWDGTYNGKPVPEGVYTYIFRGTIQHANNDIRRSGTITLIR